MKSPVWMGLIAVAVSLFFVSGVMAVQQNPAPIPKAPAQESQWNWQKVRGVIEKVDEANHAVILQSHNEKMTFSTDEHTVISQWTNKLSFTGLKKGMPATVEYHEEGNTLLAKWIDVHQTKG